MCLSFVSTLNLYSLDNDKSIIKPFFLLSASENPCPSNILTGQKFFLETSLILGPFLESIKKAIKLSEIERANIVQRQSITFTTLYLESATALMTSMVLRAERNSIKKYKLYPLIQTHPQVQIWQMHFSSAFLASEAEEGFLVASASFVDTMLSSLFQCKTRILLR